MDLDKLAAAKLWLISTPVNDGPTVPRDLPYLAHALYALIPVMASDVPSLTCDEQWRVYVNPEWLTAASIDEIGRELAHVTWHLLADHADRARDQDVDASTSRAWRLATDVTISRTLEPDALRPEGLATSADLRLPDDRSAEEYFALLARMPANDPEGDGGEGAIDPEPGCGSGCDGVRRQQELPPDASLASVPPEDAREIRRRVAVDYRDYAISRGDQAGDAWRWAAEILEPTVDWAPLLAGAVRRAAGWTHGRTDYTYSRPSRRASATPGILQPGMRRRLPTVAMVIDTSYSVDDVLLGRALGEVDGALRALGVGEAAVAVYACDAAVHTVQRVRRARDAALAGGGGTDMRVGIGLAAAARPRPDLITVFTDGWTPWPDEPPAGITVIAALLGHRQIDLPPTPAWVTRVECLS